MGHYHVAQICLNGHCITPSYDTSAELSQRFCTQCGAPTITQCPSCNAPIRGEYTVPGVIVFGNGYTVPAYCYNCGEPYPWTHRAIESAKALIQEEGAFSPADQAKLIEALPDLITQTSKTQLAASRLNKALNVAGKFAKEGLKDFIVQFGCELAKSLLGM